MALVVELSEEQLTVGAIHRTLSGLPEGTDLRAAFGRWFDMVHAGSATERVVGALGGSGALALITTTDAWLLNPKPEASEVAGSDLDASLVALALADLPEQSSTHSHTWPEALAAVRDGEAQAAVLLRPVTVEQIADWAAARRRMPPKTTYFSPKPATGMVFRVLDGRRPEDRPTSPSPG
jgi:ABC-type amino acid transport substrate-binding protein